MRFRRAWVVVTGGQLPHFSSCWILARAELELSAVFLEEGDVGRSHCHWWRIKCEKQPVSRVVLMPSRCSLGGSVLVLFRPWSPQGSVPPAHGPPPSDSRDPGVFPGPCVLTVVAAELVGLPGVHPQTLHQAAAALWAG